MDHPSCQAAKESLALKSGGVCTSVRFKSSQHTLLTFSTRAETSRCCPFSISITVSFVVGQFLHKALLCIICHARHYQIPILFITVSMFTYYLFS